MDEAALEALVARSRKDRSYLKGVAEAMTNDDDWSWLEVVPDPAREANVVAFSVGFGEDGAIYPTSFGFGAGGELVVVVTDFCIAEWAPELDETADGDEI